MGHSTCFKRRWDVFLRTGLSVKLPEDNAVLAWSKLAILDRDTKIMKRDLAVIDMRVSGQLIVEPNLPLSKKGQKHERINPYQIRICEKAFCHS